MGGLSQGGSRRDKEKQRIKERHNKTGLGDRIDTRGKERMVPRNTPLLKEGKKAKRLQVCRLYHVQYSPNFDV